MSVRLSEVLQCVGGWYEIVLWVDCIRFNDLMRILITSSKVRQPGSYRIPAGFSHHQFYHGHTHVSVWKKSSLLVLCKEY